MKNQFALARACACLLLATAGAHVHAQQTQAAAADPQTGVPATRYQSTLGQRPEAAPATTPDQNWVASNETVAATNSMSLTMKMRGQAQTADPHAGHAMPGMAMDKKEGGGMCMPGGGAEGKDKGKMACCESGCSSCCCKDMMKKKETS
jgi:hypothetical protein